jgi:glutamyl-tRNA(Gln) amidotransferase subunit E
MDDTPPFEIDQEAVRIAIELSELCNLNLVSELHVMRKQYLDGSIPTGFQRTVMIGLTGAVPFRVPELGVDRELRIRQLSLEEDSCREVSDEGHRIVFRTDRLGMPLSEMVTEPELLTPWELQAGGRLLAHLARASGKVRRGPGAARQDVNVSVAGGRRVEIKGVHYRGRLPLLVHNEGFRQLNLLRIRAEAERRGLTPGMFELPPKGDPWDVSPLVSDAGAVVRRAHLPGARDLLERGGFACAVRLQGFQGLLGRPTQPGITFDHEFAERVRVIACPPLAPFMTHSEKGDGALDHTQWQELARSVGAQAGDVVVVLWAPKEDAATAAREVLIRAREALEGVPSETRQAFPDGTTVFERILPGPDRMYPDTDTPPLPIPDSTVAEVRAGMPETPWARQARYETLGLDRRMARALSTAVWKDLFDAVAPARGEPARRLAGALEKRLPFHTRRRRGAKPRAPAELPDAGRLAPLVRALERGEIRPEALVWAVDEALGDPERPSEEILARFRPCAPAEGRLEALVTAVASGAAALNGKPREVLVRWGMGEVMRELMGRVAPDRVTSLLEAALDKQPSAAEALGREAVR